MPETFQVEHTEERDQVETTSSSTAAPIGQVATTLTTNSTSSAADDDRSRLSAMMLELIKEPSFAKALIKNPNFQTDIAPAVISGPGFAKALIENPNFQTDIAPAVISGLEGTEEFQQTLTKSAGFKEIKARVDGISGAFDCSNRR